MLDARCIFKKKVGITQDDSDGEYDEEDLSEVEKEKIDMSKAYVQRPELVKWEPSKGEIYAVLMTRSLEIYGVEDETPLHNITFNTNQTGFDFVTPHTLVVCDDKGRLSVFQGIASVETISMKIIETDQVKFRTITSCPSSEFFITISKQGI
jgi:hypothetical protein